MSGADAKVAVQVDGRTLTLTNLGKVLYPDTGFTKAEVLDYYQRVALQRQRPARPSSRSTSPRTGRPGSAPPGSTRKAPGRAVPA